SNVGLWVDEQPGLAFGGQHVLGVQVGAKQHLAVRRRREGAKGRDAFACQPRIQVALARCNLALERIRPLVTHRLQRAEPVPWRWAPPETPEEPRDDHVL